MSGRHRKPTKTAARLARAGALTVMATAPLAITGSAMAAPMAPTDRDSTDWAGLNHSSSSRADDSGWDDADDSGWGDDESSSFGRSDYAHAADDDSPSWRSDSSDSSDSSDADSASSSDNDSPSWTYAEPYSSRSDSRSDSSDSTRPSRAHRQATPPELPTRRHSEPATPQAHDAKWDKLAQCESTQNWDANTGNGYKGGLQFDDRTWRNYGGTQYAPTADQASRDEQIAVAKKVQQEQGWHAWPGCSHRLGYA
ncbi:MAG TPA: transglycosylase family protein [Pseudonocardia sp.]|nr:transglycosylase family protein [Pseudonocardia sp.]